MMDIIYVGDLFHSRIQYQFATFTMFTPYSNMDIQMTTFTGLLFCLVIVDAASFSKTGVKRSQVAEGQLLHNTREARKVRDLVFILI